MRDPGVEEFDDRAGDGPGDYSQEAETGAHEPGAAGVLIAGGTDETEPDGGEKGVLDRPADEGSKLPKLGKHVGRSPGPEGVGHEIHECPQEAHNGETDGPVGQRHPSFHLEGASSTFPMIGWSCSDRAFAAAGMVAYPCLGCRPIARPAVNDRPTKTNPRERGW